VGFPVGMVTVFGKVQLRLVCTARADLVGDRLPLRNAFYGVTHSELVAVVSAGLISLALSIIGVCEYYLYEKPFLSLKHHFDYSCRSLNHGSPDDAFTSNG
jgi:hypothetical protein